STPQERRSIANAPIDWALMTSASVSTRIAPCTGATYFAIAPITNIPTSPATIPASNPSNARIGRPSIRRFAAYSRFAAVAKQRGGPASPPARGTGKRGAFVPGRPRLAAAQLAALDLAAKRATGGRADQGAEQARATIVERVADQPADGGADDEAGRAVRAATIIAPVAPAIDTVVAGQPALAIVAAVAIIIVGIIASAARRPVP